MTLPHHAVRERLISRFASLHHEHASYRWWVLANVMIGTFMAVLDATIVNVALPKIMASFGVDVDTIEWIVTAYLLVFAVMLPTSGWMADHLGYKRTYVTALFVFTLGSFLCSLASNEHLLILARIVQGMGAGFLMPVGLAIVTREFPPRQRGLALGFWAISAAASVSLGPLIGGYLVDNLSWNSIFWVNVPVGIFAIFVTLVVQREYRSATTRSFDLLGFISMTVFLTFLLLALASGNSGWNTGGWTSTYIISCFLLSFIGLVVFLATEFTVKHPLIELGLFRHVSFAVTNLILFIFGLGMFGSTFLLPLYLQNSLGYTALQAGAMFLPVGLLQAFISPISGIVSDRINAKIPAAIGILLLAISLYMNSTMSLSTERHEIMITLVLRGIAMGLLFTPLSTLALSEIPPHKMAQASGLFNVIRQIGGSFGVAIMGTMLTRRFIFHSAIYGQALNAQSASASSVMQNLQQFIQHAAGSPPGWAALQSRALLSSNLVQQAFVQAINDDFFLAAVITILGLIPILFLHQVRHKKAGGPGPAVE
jgi:MFS transporter, DHA2 family, multidrug resistance protein